MIGLRDHDAPAEDADEDVLPLPRRIRRGAEREHLPGLPRLPGRASRAERAGVEWTIKLGLALDCEIAPQAVTSREALLLPGPCRRGIRSPSTIYLLASNGKMLVPTSEGDQVIGIVRAHLEEDAAKTTHVGGRTGRIGEADYSLIDFNRGGTPLVEIVTAPDLHSADDAKRFLQLLRRTIVELGVSDAEMEKGTLRVDANVSVRPAGSDELRTRTELKNMNSFSFVARGITREVERQIEVWESGAEVVQQTYDYDAAHDRLTPRRAKEADDYRYFPEPDMVRSSRRTTSSSVYARAARAPRRARSGGSSRSSTSIAPWCSSRAASTGSGRTPWPPAPTASPRPT